VCVCVCGCCVIFLDVANLCFCWLLATECVCVHCELGRQYGVSHALQSTALVSTCRSSSYSCTQRQSPDMHMDRLSTAAIVVQWRVYTASTTSVNAPSLIESLQRLLCKRDIISSGCGSGQVAGLCWVKGQLSRYFDQ